MNDTARNLWIASVVFFCGGIGAMVQRQDDLALILAGIGFQLVFIVESNFDWAQRITRSSWKHSLFETRVRTTPLAKLAQVMAAVCLIGALWTMRS